MKPECVSMIDSSTSLSLFANKYSGKYLVTFIEKANRPSVIINEKNALFCFGIIRLMMP